MSHQNIEEDIKDFCVRNPYNDIKTGEKNRTDPKLPITKEFTIFALLQCCQSAKLMSR